MVIRGRFLISIFLGIFSGTVVFGGSSTSGHAPANFDLNQAKEDAEKEENNIEVSESDVELRKKPQDPGDEEAQRPQVQQKAAPADPKDFKIVTWRLGGKPAVKHGIHLLTPIHKSKYTPGLIAFTWEINQPPKKKKPAVILKIESLDGKKKFAFKTKRESKQLELPPGDYKWTVISEKPKIDSKWRLFSIFAFKSRSLSGEVSPMAGARTNLMREAVNAKDFEPDVTNTDVSIKQYQMTPPSNSAPNSQPGPNKKSAPIIVAPVPEFRMPSSTGLEPIELPEWAQHRRKKSHSPPIAAESD